MSISPHSLCAQVIARHPIIQFLSAHPLTERLPFNEL
jgi:hypothetical protein